MSGARLRRVNDDSSWLLTLPADDDFSSSTFNLLIDPWLDESSQIDYHPSFSEQKRLNPALVTSVAGLENLLSDEAIDEHSEANKILPSRQIDAILLSHPFTDHTHPQTLNSSSIRKEIPYLVTEDSKAALEKIVKGRDIVTIAKADHHQAPKFLAESTRAKSNDVKSKLPANVCILKVQAQERFTIFAGAKGLAWSQLHGAILILWKGSNSIRSIVYSPHGTGSTSMPIWLQSDRIQHEAIMTSLDRIVLPNWLSGPVNLGLPAAIDCIKQGTYSATRILATHDERKGAKGMVAALLKRYWLGSQDLEEKHKSLDELKEKDADRRIRAQEIVDIELGAVKKEALVLVLKVNEWLMLDNYR